MTELMRSAIVAAVLGLMPFAPGVTQGDASFGARERALVGCWEVRYPTLDGGPWRFGLDSAVAARGQQGRVLWRARPLGHARRTWEHGVWGRLYAPSDDLYLSLGSAPGALEVAIVLSGDSLIGGGAIIGDRPPYRQPLGQIFTAKRVGCGS